MDCKQIRELLPDLAAGMTKATSEIESHIVSCTGCAAKLKGLRQTMALLDEWQAPEPSAYFDTRLQVRVREEVARPAAGWLHWWRRPAMALSLATAIVAGGVVLTNRALFFPEEMAINVPVPGVPAQPGTAVGDLQALDKNQDLYADFDILDELQVQHDVTANP